MIGPEENDGLAGKVALITGGSNGGQPPAKVDSLIAMTAKQSGGIVRELKMVPNEPLEFKHDGKMRKEDDLIAYTWNEFLQGGDDEWPARLPMVKSAVRAMDCVQELLASDEGGKLKVEKFVVAGGSTGSRSRPFVIIAGLVLSFSLTVLFATTVLSFLHLPGGPTKIRIASRNE